MEDQGALAGRIKWNGGERISDADIDPSFPNAADQSDGSWRDNLAVSETRHEEPVVAGDTRELLPLRG